MNIIELIVNLKKTHLCFLKPLLKRLVIPFGVDDSASVIILKGYITVNSKKGASSL